MPKATLPFGSELMLQRVVRLLGQVVQPLVVVAAPSQQVPDLESGVIIARDRHQGRGPLEGLLAGLTALEGVAEAAYVTSCDVPLLQPAFVRKMIQLLEDFEICVPVEGRFHHPLAAVYRTRVVPQVRSLMDAQQMRPVFLFDKVATRRVPVAELAAVDPQLSTLINLNTPADYFSALDAAGLQPAAEVRELKDQE